MYVSDDRRFGKIFINKSNEQRFKKRMLFVLAAAIIAVFGITAGAAKGAWNFDLVAFSAFRVYNNIEETFPQKVGR